MRILKPESQAVNLVDFEQTNIRLCERVKVRPKDEIKEAAGDGADGEVGFLILSKRLLWD